MNDSENILFAVRHSARFGFAVKADKLDRVKSYLEPKGVALEPSGFGDDTFFASIAECDYVRFKLLMSDAVDCISKHCEVRSDSLLEYSIVLPDVVATKIEFAINYGHASEDEVCNVNKYMDAMLGEYSGEKYDFGWTGVTPLALGSDMVLSNADVERLVYPHYVIDMREYNNRKITLACGYKPSWIIISALADYFASYVSGCAGRKADVNSVGAFNVLRTKFNRISGGFTDYASFLKMCDGKFEVSIDMELEHSYIEAFFPMIKAELFKIYNLFYQCGACDESRIRVNYDTDESRWQVKYLKSGVFGFGAVHNIDIVAGDIANTSFGNCNIMDCKVDGCNIQDGSLIGDSVAKKCVVNNCYCGISTSLVNCHVESNNTLDGLVKHSEIDDNNSYTDNARFVASRNKNNRKV